MKKFFVVVVVMALILAVSSTAFATSIGYGTWHGITGAYTNTINNPNPSTQRAYVYDINYRCRTGSYENGIPTNYSSKVCQDNTAIAPAVEIYSGDYYVWDVYHTGLLRLRISASKPIYISGTFQVI